MWTGAILAGGRARRLGGLNKAGLTLHPGGATVLDRQLARLRRVVDRIIIIANDADQFSSAGVPVIPDIVPDGGALGALYTAVHAGTEWTLVVACDMPFVSESLLAHLVSVGGGFDIAIPAYRARVRAIVCDIFPSGGRRTAAPSGGETVQAQRRRPDSGLERPRSGTGRARTIRPGRGTVLQPQHAG